VESIVKPANSLNETAPARILVVDDQPTNIQVVGSVLGKFGHEIIPASDGPTALKRLGLRKPDLILLDMLMPGMSGYDVCAQVMAHPEWKDIPIIFLSASDDKDFIVRALDAGAVDYITKPFNQAELVSRVRTQLALKAARDQLRQLAEDKDELVGILTHDLKNYLGGIHMSAELLLGHAKKSNDARLSLLTENIFRSSGLSLAFVKEFLANSAADYGLTLKPVAINFVDIATSVVQHHEVAAAQKQLEIQTDFSAGAVMVQADAQALDQVLDNLLSNAIKFSPAGKKIFVTVQTSGNFGECLIRDEGPGFTVEDKTRMFRRYGRLSARPTGGEASTGLGLSIVRKLVLDMRGELSCDSTHGQGATFTVRLPSPLIRR
jgi:two-component system sensor histidine kinase/response regulator